MRTLSMPMEETITASRHPASSIRNTYLLTYTLHVYLTSTLISAWRLKNEEVIATFTGGGRWHPFFLIHPRGQCHRIVGYLTNGKFLAAFKVGDVRAEHIRFFIPFSSETTDKNGTDMNTFSQEIAKPWMVLSFDLLTICLRTMKHGTLWAQEALDFISARGEESQLYFQLFSHKSKRKENWLALRLGWFCWRVACCRLLL